ncbi:hypothetical protein PTRA_a1257 [Pseudoalteromonas translucida KMM 520]|uniref:Uncharacterized protein n=1 Tax=Pseudoalteromonas translucida KMM 520 TaxID=1315283 RepID=A0A0U2MNQ0_9GAMM|nr:hypothetical protein PTRA_a1257 [Pseudoalteromonas translucida KMM 520]
MTSKNIKKATLTSQRPVAYKNLTYCVNYAENARTCSTY